MSLHTRLHTSFSADDKDSESPFANEFQASPKLGTPRSWLFSLVHRCHNTEFTIVSAAVFSSVFTFCVAYLIFRGNWIPSSNTSTLDSPLIQPSSVRSIERSRARFWKAVQDKGVNSTNALRTGLPVEYGCNQYDHIGDVTHGRMLICDIDRLLAVESPVVYSIGNMHQFDFELALKGLLPHSDRHAFAPAVVPDAALEVTQVHEWTIATDSTIFERYSDYASKITAFPLPQAMSMLSHSCIHILKIDVRAPEYLDLVESFKDPAAVYTDEAQTHPRIEQIILVHRQEYNFRPERYDELELINRVVDTVSILQRHYYIAGKELTPDCFWCLEYTLLHKSLARS